MKKTIHGALALMLVASAGCSNLSARENTVLKDAGIGAAAGAVIGGVAGGGEGALKGAAVGGALGGGYGAYETRRR